MKSPEQIAHHYLDAALGNAPSERMDSLDHDDYSQLLAAMTAAIRADREQRKAHPCAAGDKWEYGICGDFGDGHKRVILDDQASALGGVRGGDHVRRRARCPAGPWEPVPADGIEQDARAEAVTEKMDERAARATLAELSRQGDGSYGDLYVSADDDELNDVVIDGRVNLLDVSRAALKAALTEAGDRP